jgi:hypothetical protein
MSIAFGQRSQRTAISLIFLLFGLLGSTKAMAQEQDLITIPFVEGAPPPINERLASMVAEEGRLLGMKTKEGAVAAGGFMLKGVASASPSDDGTYALISWEIRDANEAAWGTFVVEELAPYLSADDPWLAVDHDSLLRLAVKSAEALEKELASMSPPPQAVANQSRGGETNGAQKNGRLDSTRTKVAILTVEGAPGDGEEMLSQALSQVLSQYRIVIAPTPTSQTYGVKGHVDLRDAGTRQIVHIVWSLIGPDDQIYGTVEQNNEVQKGSLDFRWGDAAVYAAAGAGDGIAALLQQLGPEPPPTSSAE